MTPYHGHGDCTVEIKHDQIMQIQDLKTKQEQQQQQQRQQQQQQQTARLSHPETCYTVY